MTVAAAWDETKHPRRPVGPRGGQFTRAGERLLARITEDSPEGVKALYEDDPQDAIATNLDRDAPAMTTILSARAIAEQRTQEYLRERFGDEPITLYRGGADSRGATTSWTTQRGTAQRFADRYGVELREITVNREDILVALEMFHTGTFAEDEMLLRRSLTAAFDPAKHPHRPAGSSQGGEWAPRGSAPASRSIRPRMVPGYVPAQEGWPAGIFSPEDSVVFWPEKIAVYSGGRDFEGPMWKALVDAHTGEELAFYFAGAGGRPHHGYVLDALRNYKRFGAQEFVAGYGNKAMRVDPASQIPQSAIDAIALRHRKDILDAREMVEGQGGVAAAGFDPLTAAFDPALHPHRPAGSPQGGEWAPTNPIEGMKIDFAEVGGSRGMPQRFRYMTVDTQGGERVGLISYRPSDDGIEIDGIAVAERFQRRGIAVAMLGELHERFPEGGPLVHGSFSSPEGVRLGVFMSAAYPEWNKLWLNVVPGAEHGTLQLWNPGEPIPIESDTFDPMPYPAGNKAAGPAIERALAAAQAVTHPTVAAGYVESEHPRDPGGEGGGQWIPKGTTGVWEPDTSEFSLPPRDYDHGVWSRDPLDLLYQSFDPAVRLPNAAYQSYDSGLGPASHRPDVWWKASYYAPTGEVSVWVPSRKTGFPHHMDVARVMGWEGADTLRDFGRRYDLLGAGSFPDTEEWRNIPEEGRAAVRLKMTSSRVRKQMRDAEEMAPEAIAAAAGPSLDAFSAAVRTAIDRLLEILGHQLTEKYVEVLEEAGDDAADRFQVRASPIVAAGWDPAKHPHRPAGDEHGGEWAPTEDERWEAIDREREEIRRPYRERGVTVYRGLKVATPSAIDMLGPATPERVRALIEMNYNMDWDLGIHWTTDPEVAERFSRPNHEFGSYGVLVEALVLPEDIIPVSEYPDYREHTVFGTPKGGEAELPIRPGSTIMVQHVTQKLDGGERLDRYGGEDMEMMVRVDDKSITSAGWDESQHPRDPGGEGGGEFIEKGTSAEGADTLWQGAFQDADWAAILKLQEAGKDEEAETAIVAARAQKVAWITSTRAAIARGDLEIEDAVARGYHPDGVERAGDGSYTWATLPETLYHATINAPAVFAEGLKTRDERGGVGGGLGGGSSQDISLTTSPEYANDIAGTLREIRSVLVGETSVQQLVDNATNGVGADRPWINDIPEIDRREVLALASGEKVPDDLDWARYRAYTTLTGYYRQQAGGPESTVPFSPDLTVIKEADPADILVVKVRPKPGARGVFVSDAEQEWRIPTGSVVTVEADLTAALPPRAEPSFQFADDGHLVEIEKIAKEVTERAGPLRQMAVAFVADAALESVGISLDLGGVFSERILARSAVRAADMGATVQDAVTTAVKEGLDEGWSVPQTADAIREQVREVTPAAANMLARTDLNGLANAASIAVARIAWPEGDIYKRWINADDNRVRPTHAHADVSGQTVPINHPFMVGGVPLDFPGDPDGPDREVCNCRCTLVYVQALTAAGWDPALHPHRPAGSPAGGEWAPTYAVLDIRHGTPEYWGVVKLVREEMRGDPDWRETLDEEEGAYSMALEAFAAENVILVRKGEQLVGVAGWRRVDDVTDNAGAGDAHGPALILRYAGAIKGGGIPLFRAAVDVAAKERMAIAFSSTSGSDPLYRRLGLLPVEGTSWSGTGNYFLTSDQVQELAIDGFSLARKRRDLDRARAPRTEWPMPFAASAVPEDGWGFDLLYMTAAAWDPALHPHRPAGDEHGGEWAPKGGGWTGPAVGADENVIYFADEEWARENADAVARKYEMTMEQYQEALEEKIHEDMERSNVLIRTPLLLVDEIATDGRFKTQHETGTSGGSFAPGIREAAERDLLGYPVTTAPADRPVYGYIATIGAQDSTWVQGYGDVVWELKHDVRYRTTFTGGDSLGRAYVPSAMMDPSYLSLHAPNAATDRHNDQDPLKRWNRDTVYIEAQIHGGVTLDDVAAVTLPAYLKDVVEGSETLPSINPVVGENETLRRAVATLKERGITVEYDRPYVAQFEETG